jgi:hypothetical protein
MSLSIAVGADGISKRLFHAHNNCIVIVGYSQGAWAIGGALSSPVVRDLKLADKVAAVVVYGDPRFDPKAEPEGMIQGSFTKGTAGAFRALFPRLAGTPYFPDGVASKTRSSVCLTILSAVSVSVMMARTIFEPVQVPGRKAKRHVHTFIIKRMEQPSRARTS